jgi:hypothetical protein
MCCCILLPQAEGHKVGAAVLLELLLWGNPISALLPKIQIPVGYYAAAADSDTPVELYVANSKKAKYVGFHVSSGSRHALFAGNSAALQQSSGSEVVVDQTMLLVALLSDVDLGAVPDASAAAHAELTAGDSTNEHQQQQQQQDNGGESNRDSADRLFPFQQPGGVRGVDQHCEMAGPSLCEGLQHTQIDSSLEDALQQQQQHASAGAL